MDPNALKPDPEHMAYPFLKELFLLSIGALLASWKRIFNRHEAKEDGHDALLADLVTRVTVLENRPSYVTLTELELAIGRALTSVREMFTPQHEDLASKTEAAIRASEQDTRSLITECNGAIRRDLGGAIDGLREGILKEILPVLHSSTAALEQANAASKQYSDLVHTVLDAIEKVGADRRKKRTR